jgi:hypothetical protein
MVGIYSLVIRNQLPDLPSLLNLSGQPYIQRQLIELICDGFIDIIEVSDEQNQRNGSG